MISGLIAAVRRALTPPWHLEAAEGGWIVVEAHQDLEWVRVAGPFASLYEAAAWGRRKYGDPAEQAGTGLAYPAVTAGHPGSQTRCDR